MYCMNKRRETFGWKLIIYVGGFNVECMLGRMEPLLPLSKAIYKDLETPPPPTSESFTTSSRTGGGERHHQRRNRNSSPKNMGNDAMSKALCQISKSPFTSHIRRAKLAHHFSQPTFTIYNGRTDPVEHVSHFN